MEHNPSHDLPRPSHICFFSLQSDTAGYCAALYFGMQKYLILIHPIRARQWSSPLRSHEISCLVIWHDTTWHEMTWHSWWNLLQYQHNCRTFMPKVLAWPCLTYSGRRFLQFLMVMADHKFRTLLPKNFRRLDCIFSCWFCLDCWNFPWFFLMCQTLPDKSYLLHGLYGFSAFQQVMIFGYFGGGAPSVCKQIARRWDGRWEGVSWILRVLWNIRSGWDVEKLSHVVWRYLFLPTMCIFSRSHKQSWRFLGLELRVYCGRTETGESVWLSKSQIVPATWATVSTSISFSWHLSFWSQSWLEEN